MDGKAIARIIDSELASRGISKAEFYENSAKSPVKSTQTVEITGFSHALSCS